MSGTKKFLLLLSVMVAGYIVFRYSWHVGTIAYFNYKCEKYGGEFIYETVDNVNGILQMRTRNPEDYFDRLSKNDIPEDPYGHTNWEAQNPGTLFVNERNGYFFPETEQSPNLSDKRYPLTKLNNTPAQQGQKYWRYSLSVGDEELSLFAENVSSLKSKYGFTWNETRSLWDRFFGVWGGELIIMRLNDDSILGLRRGYFYRGIFSDRLEICPEKGHKPTLDFLRKVLKPASAK